MLKLYSIKCDITNYDKRSIDNFTLLLRGALGYSIKEVSDELFRFVFKPKRRMFKDYMLRKLRSIPKPITITPPIIYPYNKIEFSIILFGNTIYYEDYIIEAIIGLEKRSIGALKVKVDSISACNTFDSIRLELYNKGIKSKYNAKECIISDEQIYDYSKKVADICKQLRLEFITPTLIISNDDRLKASTIIKYAMRRRTLLNYFYGNGFYYISDKVLEVADWVDNNTDIELKLVNINRVLKGMRGFFIGSISLSFTNKSDEMVYAIDALKFSEFMGIGKATAFGMGRYVMSIS